MLVLDVGSLHMQWIIIDLLERDGMEEGEKAPASRLKAGKWRHQSSFWRGYKTLPTFGNASTTLNICRNDLDAKFLLLYKVILSKKGFLYLHIEWSEIQSSAATSDACWCQREELSGGGITAALPRCCSSGCRFANWPAVGQQRLILSYQFSHNNARIYT